MIKFDLLLFHSAVVPFRAMAQRRSALSAHSHPDPKGQFHLVKDLFMKIVSQVRLRPLGTGCEKAVNAHPNPEVIPYKNKFNL
jgi:hypothetical protein